MNLSIITINYNNAKGLEKTIESIISQKFNNFEYIVIDGGSNDNSVDVIKKYTDEISFWVSEPDSGVYNAMNKGIKYAKGDYVLFLNSGDTLNKKIDRELIENNLSGEDIIYFNLEVSNMDGSFKYIKRYPDNPDFKYFVEDTLPHPGTFIKRDRLVEYGLYNEKFNIVSDWAFFIDAILKYKCTSKHVNYFFSTFYTDGISSLPENQEKISKERQEHLIKSFSEYYSLYEDWYNNRIELNKLKKSSSVKFLKKIGFLRWLTIK